MDDDDEIIKKHIDLIKQYLSGRITIHEFINLVHDLPKLATPLPCSVGAEGAHLWD